MAISKTSKEQIIQSLLVAKQKAHMLEISLRFKGKPDEADQLSAKAGELSDQIDNLLSQLMSGWIGTANKILGDITKANAAIQSTIRDIQNDVHVAENIVKAIGYVDDIVVIASKIAAKM